MVTLVVIKPPEVEPRTAPMTAGQFLTVMLTPELNVLPAELKASDTRAYEPLGTVVVFQLHNHP